MEYLLTYNPAVICVFLAGDVGRGWGCRLGRAVFRE